MKVIPTEIKSEVKLHKFISMKDIIFLCIVLTVTSNFSSIVHPNLEIFYLVYCIIWSFILIIPAGKSNPKRKIYELIIILISKSRTVFKPIQHLNKKEEYINEEIA